MANFTFGNDIATDVKARAGLDDADNDLVRRMINRGYMDILEEAPWPWALKYPCGIIDMLKEEEDEITITQYTKDATVTVAHGTTDYAGRMIQTDTKAVPYYVVSHATYALTLDATWKEDSVSGVDCTIYQDVYDLASDCLKPWSFRDRTTGIPIDLVDLETFRMREGHPPTNTYGGEITIVKTGQVQIRRRVADGTTIEYLYTESQDYLDFSGSGAADTPVVPVLDRHILSDLAYRNLLKEWEDRTSVANKIDRLTQTINYKLGKMKEFYLSFGDGHLSA